MNSNYRNLISVGNSCSINATLRALLNCKSVIALIDNNNQPNESKLQKIVKNK